MWFLEYYRTLKRERENERETESSPYAQLSGLLFIFFFFSCAICCCSTQHAAQCKIVNHKAFKRMNRNGITTRRCEYTKSLYDYFSHVYNTQIWEWARAHSQATRTEKNKNVQHKTKLILPIYILFPLIILDGFRLLAVNENVVCAFMANKLQLMYAQYNNT